MAPLLSLVGLGVVAVATVFALTGQVPFLGSPGVSGDRTCSQAGRRRRARCRRSTLRSRSRAHSSTQGRQPVDRDRGHGRQLTKAGRDSEATGRRQQLGRLDRDARDKGPLPGRRCREELRPQVPDPVPEPPDGTGRRRSCPASTRAGPAAPTPGSGSSSTPRSRPTARGWPWSRDETGTDQKRRGAPVRRPADEAAHQRRAAGVPAARPAGPGVAPDGRYILYVLNARNRSAGAPAIWRYDTTTKTRRRSRRRLHGASWSRTGATSRGAHDITGHGRRDPRREGDGDRPRQYGWPVVGARLVAGWGAARVPAALGDDRRPPAATLQRSPNGDLSVVKIDPLTTFSGLDGNSRPAWRGPAPSPVPSPSPAPSPSSPRRRARPHREPARTSPASRPGARSVGSVLCVGIDPAPEALPGGFPGGLAGVERFALLIVEATAPFAAAMKPNLAARGLREPRTGRARARAGRDPGRRPRDRRREAWRRRDDGRPAGGRALRCARR